MGAVTCSGSVVQPEYMKIFGHGELSMHWSDPASCGAGFRGDQEIDGAMQPVQEVRQVHRPVQARRRHGTGVRGRTRTRTRAAARTIRGDLRHRRPTNPSGASFRPEADRRPQPPQPHRPRCGIVGGFSPWFPRCRTSTVAISHASGSHPPEIGDVWPTGRHDALDYAHRKNVVRRDIKPGQHRRHPRPGRTGGSTTWRFLDFGIAGLVTDATAMTAANMVVRDDGVSGSRGGRGQTSRAAFDQYGTGLHHLPADLPAPPRSPAISRQSDDDNAPPRPCPAVIGAADPPHSLDFRFDTARWPRNRHAVMPTAVPAATR